MLNNYIQALYLCLKYNHPVEAKLVVINIFRDKSMHDFIQMCLKVHETEMLTTSKHKYLGDII